MVVVVGVKEVNKCTVGMKTLEMNHGKQKMKGKKDELAQ